MLRHLPAAEEMKITRALQNWRNFHKENFKVMLASSDRKSLPRQAVEAAVLFWRYRHPPVQYLRCGLYLKTAPSDWRGRLPNAFIRRLQSELNPTDAVKFVEDKRLFRERLEAAGLPAIREVFGIDARGVIRDADGEELTSGEAADLLGHEHFFAKPIDGCLGEGARLIRHGDDIDAFLTTAQNMIVQPLIRQHPLLQKLSPHAVCTVRIDTLRAGNAWVSNAAVLKVGLGESIVDNGLAGGLAIGIDLETGALQEFGRQKPKYSTDVYDRHPDTGVVFKDFVLPHWQLLRETVVRAAEAMLPLRTLGWDVAITEDGVMLVEADSRWIPDLFQIGWGGLADTMVGQMAWELRGRKTGRSAVKRRAGGEA